MNSDKQASTHIAYQSQPVYKDEISLIDLWQVLVRQKKIIVGLTAIVTIGAVFYALLLPPIYSAKTTFLPPSESDIQKLHVQYIQGIEDIQGVEGINVDTVYTMFKQNLFSRPPRLATFTKMDLLEKIFFDRKPDTSIDAIFDDFNESIFVSIPKSKKGDVSLPIITLSIEGADPTLIAEVANRIAMEAQQATIAEIVLNIETKVAAKIRTYNKEIQLLREKVKKQRMDEIKRLETADALEKKKVKDEILTLRKIEKHNREDRIVTLQEAASIAHALGIKDPIGYKLKKISDAPSNKSQITTSIGTPNSQLYTKGYEAIEAEISSLSKRTTDDPFIPNLRELQKKLLLLKYNRKVEQLKKRNNDDPFISTLRDKENELARLSAIHIDPKTINVARLEQAAYPPVQRSKPNRRLIVILGFILGLMLGIFGAFFSNLIANARNSEKKLKNS